MASLHAGEWPEPSMGNPEEWVAWATAHDILLCRLCGEPVEETRWTVGGLCDLCAEDEARLRDRQRASARRARYRHDDDRGLDEA